MRLNDEMLKKIKEEITNDPQKIGYITAKNDEEVATLLSNGGFTERIVQDAYPSPLSRILTNMANSPNIITSTEVTQAKITI